MIRSKSIAITPSLSKWLHWAAIAEDITPEALLDTLATTALLAKYPNIKTVQDAHDVASDKLWNEAADKLKEGK